MTPVRRCVREEPRDAEVAIGSTAKALIVGVVQAATAVAVKRP